MALTKCSLCGKRISSEAISCPGCGEPRPDRGWPKPRNKIAKWLIIAVATIAILYCSTHKDLISSVYAVATTKEAVYNSPFDHSVSQVVNYIKPRLKDPDSFEVIAWGDVIKGPEGAYQVSCLYRAKNSFGAYVVEDVLIQLDRYGHVTKSVKFVD
jgi:hypothetical protein